MSQEYDHELMLAYVEDELEPAARLRFNCQLDADPRLRSLVQGLRDDRRRLRQTGAVAAPEDLLERARGLLERQMLLGATAADAEEVTAYTRHRMLRWVTVSGVAAAFVLATGTLLFIAADTWKFQRVISRMSPGDERAVAAAAAMAKGEVGGSRGVDGRGESAVVGAMALGRAGEARAVVQEAAARAGDVGLAPAGVGQPAREAEVIGQGAVVIRTVSADPAATAGKLRAWAMANDFIAAEPLPTVALDSRLSSRASRLSDAADQAARALKAVELQLEGTESQVLKLREELARWEGVPAVVRAGLDGAAGDLRQGEPASAGGGPWLGGVQGDLVGTAWPSEMWQRPLQLPTEGVPVWAPRQMVQVVIEPAS